MAFTKGGEVNHGDHGHNQLWPGASTTTMKLFDLKLMSIWTCGMEILCKHLGENCLQTFESVRATYLTKVLRVSRFTLASSIRPCKRKSGERYMMDTAAVIYQCSEQFINRRAEER